MPSTGSRKLYLPHWRSCIVAAGFLGGDRGEQLRAELEARAMERDFVKVAGRTRQCITLLDTSVGMQTELVEESQPVTAADYDELMRIIRLRVQGCRAVVMSGTITPGGPADLYFQVAHMAHEAGAITVVDAQGAALIEALRAKPGLGKPNRAPNATAPGRSG